MPKHRIFIAIDIPEKLEDICEKYLKPFSDNKNIRVPKKENWHITVSFLGYLSSDELEKLKGVVENVCLETEPFKISTDKIV